MSRHLAAAILAVFVFQAVGVSLAAGFRCAEQCEDDGPDGQCPPSCIDCWCCAHPRATAVSPLAMTAPPFVRLVRAVVGEGTPPETEIVEIFRIPKTFLANFANA